MKSIHARADGYSENYDARGCLNIGTTSVRGSLNRWRGYRPRQAFLSAAAPPAPESLSEALRYSGPEAERESWHDSWGRRAGGPRLGRVRILLRCQRGAEGGGRE